MSEKKLYRGEQEIKVYLPILVMKINRYNKDCLGRTLANHGREQWFHHSHAFSRIVSAESRIQ